MGLRFRKNFTIVPGVRINLSKSGLSASLGRKGATANISAKGLRSTVGLPGSGFSYQTKAGFGVKAIVIALIVIAVAYVIGHGGFQP